MLLPDVAMDSDEVDDAPVNTMVVFSLVWLIDDGSVNTMVVLSVWSG